MFEIDLEAQSPNAAERALYKAWLSRPLQKKWSEVAVFD
jgi:hypothetical protein